MTKSTTVQEEIKTTSTKPVGVVYNNDDGTATIVWATTVEEALKVDLNDSAEEPKLKKPNRYKTEYQRQQSIKKYLTRNYKRLGLDTR